MYSIFQAHKLHIFVVTRDVADKATVQHCSAISVRTLIETDAICPI